jgi:hypothetical protein
VGEPLDWMTRDCPRRWNLRGRNGRVCLDGRIRRVAVRRLGSMPSGTSQSTSCDQAKAATSRFRLVVTSKHACDLSAVADIV